MLNKVEGRLGASAPYPLTPSPARGVCGRGGGIPGTRARQQRRPAGSHRAHDGRGQRPRHAGVNNDGPAGSFRAPDAPMSAPGTTAPACSCAMSTTRECGILPTAGISPSCAGHATCEAPGRMRSGPAPPRLGSSRSMSTGRASMLGARSGTCPARAACARPWMPRCATCSMRSADQATMPPMAVQAKRFVLTDHDLPNRVLCSRARKASALLASVNPQLFLGMATTHGGWLEGPS